MQQRNLSIQMLAPAFLGDAEQKGTWRTPPFKALLREWWRVAAAAEHAFDHRRLREHEGLLFGNAWLEPVGKQDRFCQSKLRMAFEHWNLGTLKAWEGEATVMHPEVGRQVGSHLYLGYGPLTYDRQNRQSALKSGAALQADATNVLRLAWPEKHSPEMRIDHTLQLIDWFGTVGGRSRNGWGSLALSDLPQRAALHDTHPLLRAVLRPLEQCLKLDWPHAIGQDAQGALVWHSSKAFTSWREAMQFLAQTKIGFRTALDFRGGGPHHSAQERHLLAYPVTNHALARAGSDARQANQLRFKLYQCPDGKLRVRIFHTPHGNALSELKGPDPLATWAKVHRWLDDPTHQLQRLGAAT